MAYGNLVEIATTGQSNIATKNQTEHPLLPIFFLRKLPSGIGWLPPIHFYMKNVGTPSLGL